MYTVVRNGIRKWALKPFYMQFYDFTFTTKMMNQSNNVMHKHS